MEDNLIKKVCKELGITQKELAEKIGYKVDTINKAASTGKISEPLKKAIELLIENLKLKKELEKFTKIKKIFKEWLSE